MTSLEKSSNAQCGFKLAGTRASLLLAIVGSNSTKPLKCSRKSYITQNDLRSS